MPELKSWFALLGLLLGACGYVHSSGAVEVRITVSLRCSLTNKQMIAAFLSSPFEMIVYSCNRLYIHRQFHALL